MGENKPDIISFGLTHQQKSLLAVSLIRSIRFVRVELLWFPVCLYHPEDSTNREENEAEAISSITQETISAVGIDESKGKA